MSQTRRLAAILAADVAGYSRLIGADESGTFQGFRAIRTELFDPTIAAHNGRLVKTLGEACSLVDALRCAVAVRRERTKRNAEVAPDRRAVSVEEGDIFRRWREWGPAPDGSYDLQLLLVDLLE